MSNIPLDAVYRPSEDLVTRDIEGEIIIVPLSSGIGDLGDDLFTLNGTGRLVWQQIDGTRTVQQVIDAVSTEAGQPAATITSSVLAFIDELLQRKMLVVSA